MLLLVYSLIHIARAPLGYRPLATEGVINSLGYHTTDKGCTCFRRTLDKALPYTRQHQSYKLLNFEWKDPFHNFCRRIRQNGWLLSKLRGKRSSSELTAKEFLGHSA